jgi:hypothetical protein
MGGRFVRISATSPIPSSNCSSASSRSNQRACPLASIPTRPLARSLRSEIAIKLFGFLTVLESPLLQFPSFGIHKRNLLEARVVITTYTGSATGQCRASHELALRDSSCSLARRAQARRGFIVLENDRSAEVKTALLPPLRGVGLPCARMQSDWRLSRALCGSGGQRS